MKNEKELNEHLQGKRVLYIATKNCDYIRIEQEIEWVRRYSSSCTIVAFSDKKYWTRVYKVYKKILRLNINDFDIIVIGFMAQMVHLMFPRKFNKKEIISDFFISIYDTLVFDRKKVRRESYKAGLLKRIDEYVIKKSDYLIVDTIAHGNYFSEELGADRDKLFVLYLKADYKIYYPRRQEKPEVYKDKFVILYFGSILPLQGVDVVLQVVKALKYEKNIHFIIIGPINNKFQRVESENVTYIDWLPQEKLAEFIAFSDLCLAGHFAKDINKANRTIPGKAYIYKAMGKKMVLGKSQANYELFHEDDKTFFVERGNIEQLKSLIEEKYHADGKKSSS